MESAKEKSRVLAKRYLEYFIKSPSTETLLKFARHLNGCLYSSCIDSNFSTVAQHCPKLCYQLSKERYATFASFLCVDTHYIGAHYMGAWGERLAELTLHLIQFNAYADSQLKGDNHGAHRG
jgi:hypothetical protein